MPAPAIVEHGLDVSPRLLRRFVTLCEELHFGRAADRVFVAQPAFSRSIQQLERLVGGRLFVRTTRQVQPTPRALALLPAAKDVLASIDQMTRELVADSARALKVAHVPNADTTALILDELARTHPEIAVDERTLGGIDQLAGVLDGSLDVALCGSAHAATSRLHSKPVRADPLIVAHIARGTGPSRPSDPRRRSIGAADYGAEEADYEQFLSDYEQAAGCRLRRVPVAAGSGTEAYAMRRAGVTAFVTLASRPVRSDAAHCVNGLTPLQPYFCWRAVWRGGARRPALQAFLDAADRVARRRRWHTYSLPGDPWTQRGWAPGG